MCFVPFFVSMTRTGTVIFALPVFVALAPLILLAFEAFDRRGIARGSSGSAARSSGSAAKRAGVSSGKNLMVTPCSVLLLIDD